MSEYIADGAALTHTAARIRAKTGGTDPITWDAANGFGDAVDAISAGGETFYRTAEGMAYTPHEVWTALSKPLSKFRNNLFRGATELIDFEWDVGGNLGDLYVFSDCPKLVSVKLPKCTGMWLGNTSCFTSTNTALRTVQLGSIGTPVVRMDAGPFRLPGPITLTLFVDAETLDGVPALVKDNVTKNWPANTTVIYKKSTTGEVIEG